MSDLRVGILGFGLAGEHFHAPFIDALDGMRLLDISTSRREYAHSKYPQATIHETPASLLDRSDVELVVVATPSRLHAEHARQALESGRHVVIDKPFTVTTSEADELIELAEQKNRVLSVFHNRRWDGDFMTVRKLVEENRLGRIHRFESAFDRYAPVVQDRWRELLEPGAGLLYDLGPHLIDQTLVLFGPPRWIHARLMKQREGAVTDDFFHITLGYDELTAVLTAGRLYRTPGPRFRLDGTNGSLVKHGVDPQEDQLRRNIHPLTPGFGEDDADNHARIVWDEDDQALAVDGRLRTHTGTYIEYYRQLRDAIRGRGEVPVPAQAGRETIRIVEAAFQSDREGRRIDL